MDVIVGIVKQAFDTIVGVLSEAVNIPLLVSAVLAVVIAVVFMPGRRPQKVNAPFVSAIFIPIAAYLFLWSLTFLTRFGVTITDIIIVSLIVLIACLFWLFGLYGPLGKIAVVILAVVVITAIGVTGSIGPTDSLMASFVRNVQSAFETLSSSLKSS